MPNYFTYADVSLFRNWMAGSGHSSVWTDDAVALRLTLEAVSRTMENYVGKYTFGPRTATRYYDLGIGNLRDSRAVRIGQSIAYPDYWASRFVQAGMVALDDWLLTASSVTAYSGTARATNVTLTEGIAGDYLLEPYNSSPKSRLKLQEETTKALNAGQQTLAIAGTWGFQNVSHASGATGTVANGTSTTFTITVTAFSAGMTILCETEQMYVTAVNASDLTVVRGVNGTTAAAHSAAATSIIDYPSDIAEMCIQLARNRWKERDGGNVGLLGSGEMAYTRPGSEERALLKRLDDYLGTRELSGVFF